jgi:chlorobactene glucosyltransferase
MLVLVSGTIWAGLVVYLLSRALRQFRAYRITALISSGGLAPLPDVSIIVPVRNEIDNIDRCIAGLTAQTCLTRRSSIMIVDDESQDGTVEALQRLAARKSRIRLVAAGALPEGWFGKPHACWRGALAAETEWLCFIDADVRAAPGLVAAAIATAEAQRIDMLSLHPLQELGSFWERVVIPAGLLMIACAKPFRTAAEDAANGQFLLIRRDAYFGAGGHAAVRDEICEDKALAARVREEGLKFRVFGAEPLAQTRMYRDFGSLWEGLSKNATEILGSARATLIAAAAAFTVGWTALLLPWVLAVIAFREPSAPAIIGGGLALFGSVVVIGIQLATSRHFRIPAAFGLTFALGYTVAACLACRSVMARIEGRVTWKGRTYQLHKTSPERM